MIFVHDPKRIQAFCNRLARAWEMLPDWRFGQLMFNVLSEFGRDPFYCEDDQMIDFLENYVMKYSPYTSPGQPKVE